MTSCPRCAGRPLPESHLPAQSSTEGLWWWCCRTGEEHFRGMALASRRNDPSPHTGVAAFVALRRSQRPVFGADQPKSPENRSRSPAIAITRDRATHRR
jgi:hypothetical protein